MRFHLGEVLTVTTGRLVSLSHMSGVYNICDGMTGVANMTHELPGVAEHIAPAIFAQRPELAGVVVPDFGKHPTMRDVEDWLASLYPTYGEYIELKPLKEVI